MSDIRNETYGRFVSGSTDDDYIFNNQTNVTIDAGNGDDVVDNNGKVHYTSNYIVDYYRFSDNTSINGGAGNDSIQNYSDNSTLIGGAGDDTIVNKDSGSAYNMTRYLGRKVSIDGGSGNDLIENGGTNVTINSGEGNDFIINGWYGNYSTTNAGSGKDTIENNCGKVTINSGTGNDSINNKATSVIINAGTGNDTIKVELSSNTINGGAGNDRISLGSDATNNLVQYKSGDGNDKIYGFNETSTLQIGGGKGTYSTIESGDDIIVTVGKGKITIVGGMDLDELKIDGAQLLNVTNAIESPVTLDAEIKFANASKRTAAVDITGNKLANSIVGGKGNDSLFGGYGADTLSGGNGDDILDGGRGNDSLSGGSGNDYINGDTGNDKLYGGKGNDILIGGKGNDSLWGNAGADKFIYESGDGKDIIFGFDNKDTLTLNGLDFTSSYSKSKGTITFKVDGGSITLKDFTATTFHINDDIYKISGSKFQKQ